MFGLLRLFEARLQAELDNHLLKGMGLDDMIAYRPRCCGCQKLADGRICYAGKHNNIIDNPFCRDCYSEIYRQTRKLVKEFFKSKTEADFILIQKWHMYSVIPPLPSTVAQLIAKGSYFHEHPPSYNSLP